jgi:LPS-assembly protein
VYRGELTGQLAHRGYPMAGLVVDSELVRSFGSGPGALVHTIAPSVELRYVPFVLGSAPVPYDDLDLAIPEGSRLLQAVAEVRQRLWRREGLASAEVASLDLGQGVDLLNDSSGSRLRDSYARFRVFRAPVTAFGLARAYLGPAPENSPVQRIAQLSAGLTVDDARGDALFASYDYLFNEGSDQTRRGIDTLVGAPALLFHPDYAEQVVAGFRLKLKFGLSLEYAATVGRTSYNLEVLPVYSAAPLQLMLRMQTLGVSYGPACDCWRIEAHALQTPNYDLLAQKKSPFAVFPAVGASLTITGLGSVGTGG